jgi:hypothetical protein
MSKKIDSKTLQTVIEIQRAAIMEGMNSSEAKLLFASVTDLYEEINDFEEEAPVAAINALTPHLKSIKDALELMMQNPMSYVTASNPKKVQQKVTLKAVKSED